MKGKSTPGYARVRGGVNGPSRATLVYPIDGKMVELYDPPQVAANFGMSVMNARAHGYRGSYGPTHVINGKVYYEKARVDKFLPDARGPKRRSKAERARRRAAREASGWAAAAG